MKQRIRHRDRPGVTRNGPIKIGTAPFANTLTVPLDESVVARSGLGVSDTERRVSVPCKAYHRWVWLVLLRNARRDTTVGPVSGVGTSIFRKLLTAPG